MRFPHAKPMVKPPRGYSALAGPYTKTESWMLQRVVSDLERGHIPFRVIPVAVHPKFGTNGMEVWRGSLQHKPVATALSME